MTERLAQLSRTRAEKARFQGEAQALSTELRRRTAQLSDANAKLRLDQSVPRDIAWGAS